MLSSSMTTGLLEESLEVSAVDVIKDGTPFFVRAEELIEKHLFFFRSK